jgi:DNA-directed RNA polymerase specialized sigma24 family protein
MQHSLDQEDVGSSLAATQQDKGTCMIAPSDRREPAHLPIAELVQATRGEIAQFLRGQPTDDTYGLALFRRAIASRDDQAWSGLYTLYRAVVDSWIAHQAPALSHEDREALVNETFAKFYRSIGPERFARFPSVRSLLAYLKRCAWSVTADYRRSQQARSREEPLAFTDQEEAVLDDPADIVATQLAAQELWQILWREATGVQERLILQIVCALGKSPRQLQQAYPALFASVEDIYRIKRNVLERLRRNHRLLAHRAEKSGRRGAQTAKAVPV